MVLSKLPVPVRPIYFDYSGARAYCACSRYGWGCLDIFSLVNHFSFLSQGWSSGAMVLGKLPVLERPTNLDYSRARACCAYSRVRVGVVLTFFLSSIISLFFLPLSGRRPDID